MTDTTTASRIDAREKLRGSGRVRQCMRPPPAKPVPSPPPPPKI